VSIPYKLPTPRSRPPRQLFDFFEQLLLPVAQRFGRSPSKQQSPPKRASPYRDYLGNGATQRTLSSCIDPCHALPAPGDAPNHVTFIGGERVIVRLTSFPLWTAPFGATVT